MKRPLANSFPNKLFKKTQNAIEEFVHTDEDSVVLQQSRIWARAITWTLIGVTGFAVGWLALAKTEEIVTVRGKLEPIGVVKDIQVPVGGVVEKILVKGGDHVKKGQTLLLLDAESTTDQRRAIIKSISYKEQQLALKEIELQRFL